MRFRFPVFSRALLPLLLLILTAVSVPVSISVPVSAQEQSIPNANYDWGINLLRDGRTLDAQKQFAKELNTGFKIATERWLDSICYAAMLGESQYQLGQYGPALENFNTAIRISIQYSNWLANVQNLPNPSAFTLKPVPWGDPNPGRRLLNIPSKFPILFGDLNYADKYRTGGVAMAPQLKPIRGVEIARCTMLALRRRAELLGPLGAGDELNGQFITKTSLVQRALAGTWFQAWLDIELGLGYLAVGKTDEAAMALQKGALINGSAHSLSVIAYLELGKLQLKIAKYEKAYNYFLEAATIAFYYEDVEGMTEAFEGLETAYCLRNPQMICPPLAQAAEWAKFKKLAFLFATVQTAAADDFLRLRQLKPAADCLLLAEKAVGKPDQYVLKGRLGSTINYQKARIAFLNPAPASQANGYAFLGVSMEFMRLGGIWNFQINQVDSLLLTGQTTTRKALELYSLLLREPTALDWALNPIEAMSATVTPRPGTWENFFLCAIDMEKKEEALEISERARKAAFLQTLDLGGRVHALRLLLDGPEKDLTVTQAQRKRDILTEYPAFENYSKKVRDLQIQVRKMSLPVTAAQKDEQRELVDALRKIAELSRAQEAILMSMALDRRVIEILFPKVRTCKEIQESLPKGEALLVSFAARNQMFYFLMNNERMAMWKIFDSGSGSGSSRQNKSGMNLLTSLQTNFASMLREIGLGAGTIPAKTLKENDWKKSSQRVMADLTKNSQANFASADFSSLIIVPDRFMWYLPFEALQIQTSKGFRPTISQFSIRYVPMASLATPWKKMQYPKSPYSIIVAGKNTPNEKAVERLEKTLERPVLFEEKSFGGIQPGTPGTGSSVFAPEFDKMFVFDDLKNTEGDSYGIFPMALDRTSREGSLGYWFLLPSGSPRLIVLTGMRTRCEDLAKKSAKKTKSSPYVPGQELFLTSMAFLANGAETVVLPRWRLEGDSPWKLAAHFNAQLSETENSADAWRRAVLKFSAGDVSIHSEPRIGKSDEIDAIPASHPLFWAGFMLVDSGSGSLRSKERLALTEDDGAEEAGGLAVPAPKEERPAANAEKPEESAPEDAPAPKPVPDKGRLAPLPPMGGEDAPQIPMGGGNPPSIPMGGERPAPLE
ncbi:MAG: CHAT domain-containing protein [Thermoguttaceae bacterium]|nr:CHAT domain-containing protein [Thermoguttaceae bacterium]